MAKKADRKTCFVVGPIGADDSDDRIHADWLLEEIIQPVFAEDFSDFDVTRADIISDPGRIDAQVISHLLESELVIADLTTLNPNAFYEIGIRHTVQKPIIHMHLEGQRIPFDIASFRSIKFERKRPKDLKAAREALKAAVASALDPKHEVDNPVTFARGRVEFDKTATPAQRVVQEQLEAISQRLEHLEAPNPVRSKAIIDAIRKYSAKDIDVLDNLSMIAATQSVVMEIKSSSLLAPTNLIEDVLSSIRSVVHDVGFTVIKQDSNSVVISLSPMTMDDPRLPELAAYLEKRGCSIIFFNDSQHRRRQL